LAVCVIVYVRPAIESVPVRCAVLVLGAMVKLAEPLPEPLAPEVTVIQVALLTEVQLHPAVVVTVVDPLPPAAGTDWLDGEIVNAHPLALCVTVNVWPAIIAVPVRGWVAVFAVALRLTVPLPVPVAPLVTVSQLVLLLTAVHEQPVGAVTLVEIVPAPATMSRLVGVSAKVHPAAACVTVNISPPIVSVPLREPALVFAATLNATVPFPLPLAPLVTVSQDVLLLTPVHAHPADVVTVVEPAPPLEVTDWLVGDNE
jgi:hypothetical protein